MRRRRCTRKWDSLTERGTEKRQERWSEEHTMRALKRQGQGRVFYCRGGGGGKVNEAGDFTANRGKFRDLGLNRSRGNSA